MITKVASQQAERIQQVFEAQKANQYEVARSTARQRIAKLDKLYKTVFKYQKEIQTALYNDFKKPASEVDLIEIYVVASEIRHAKHHLRKWMKPRRVKTPLAFLGSSSKVIHEPKGVCLIISPWNYPLNLTFGPLVSAIAAGNTVMIKPSEYTPHISALMKKMVEEVFEENEVAVFEGAVDTSTELLSLPFNHIFFTGSPAVGKIVMAAAAKNLSSVTLELGGKCPTIIDETANLKAAVGTIAWGKFANTGQTCIAPDYVYVHESKLDQFTKLFKAKIKEYYGENPEDSESYPRVVNEKQYNRVKEMLQESVQMGAEVILGGKSNAEDNMIEPTVVVNVPKESPLMKEEIFGPLLPILTYKNLDEVIDYVRAGEKPLALYMYTNNARNAKKVMAETRAGTAAINNAAVHFFNNNLPFGGSNNSGIGKGHGHAGFLAFSNEKALYQQHIPGALTLLMPPYNELKSKLIQLTIRYF
ncbi:MAG: aldehyde dehydrogenase family protein [Bacteroidia bacterium]|nr:aldehyde dehydrogenase family protein [Bacteroidia bacterium]